MLVLWLPAPAVIQEHMTDQDREVDGSYMQPANNRVLYVGWASLQNLKRVKTSASLPVAWAQRNVTLAFTLTKALSIIKEWDAEPMYMFLGRHLDG